MPTGYTAAIAEGITFDQFVMHCARAMGALVMMRDEPFDAPIPERFEPSSYDADKIAEITKNLVWYENMADSEVEREAEKEYAELLAAHEATLQNKANLHKAYASMLAKVESWTPPTQDHAGFKQFMLDQIAESIRFDCGTSYYQAPVKLDGIEWRSKKIDEASADLERRKLSHSEEVQRTEQRNEWLRQLRDSLKGASA